MHLKDLAQYLACNMYSVNVLAPMTTIIAFFHISLLISLGQISTSGILGPKKHTLRVFEGQAEFLFRKGNLYTYQQ